MNWSVLMELDASVALALATLALAACASLACLIRGTAGRRTS